jgi:hypothetical protein
MILQVEEMRGDHLRRSIMRHCLRNGYEPKGRELARIPGRAPFSSSYAQPPHCPQLQKAQRSSAAPTVKPAPTEAISTRLPFFSLPSSMAVFMAKGIVPAVVLP